MSEMIEPLRGPNRMEQECLAMIPKLDAEIAAAKNKRQATVLRRRRRLCRDIAKWCRTRAGYVIDLKGNA
ncbi:MAG: hypothetical protein JNN10_09365 [Sphingopyxis sp.]|uniref:hypothetical protein n=1 Tax=Sphingopyxis sp. TaxID=1908224 RepID=UPI001A47DE39|nr:hypothetical protein [Sphingopyxis sp.]MBL9066487.1 hypothetical protein [Sphingopyxis sp.]